MSHESTPIQPLTDWRERSTISVEQAGTILGVGRSAVYAGVRSGDIPSIRVGKRLLCPTAKLRALLGENENSATAGNRDAVDRSAGGVGHDRVYAER
jgi:excisionase family DNA binding protein